MLHHFVIAFNAIYVCLKGHIQLGIYIYFFCQSEIIGESLICINIIKPFLLEQ